MLEIAVCLALFAAVYTFTRYAYEALRRRPRHRLDRRERSTR